MDILGFAQFGYEGEIVKVETDLRRGIPATDIVGLPDGAVKEARERVRAAIRNSKLEFPRERILINLSPANLKKEGSAFDLAIALSLLASAEGLDVNNKSDAVMVLGELELSGTVRKVRGISAAVAKALEEGINTFILPAGNLPESNIFPEVKVYPVDTLEEAYKILKGKTGIIRENSAVKKNFHTVSRKNGEYKISWNKNPGLEKNFHDISGQDKLIRALQIAAAGGHHIIVYGPPGCGKTMSLTRFPSLLPALDNDTAATLTRIYSIAGITDKNPGEAPFRTPHQNCSLEGMAGGGKNCGPGEISLAHGGVLFLDETALFRSSVLQALRAPLESGKITLSRAGRQTTFPARFQLLAAMNPCPCGKFGVPGKICTCTPAMVEKYWQQLTEPLLDRMDLRVEAAVPSVVYEGGHLPENLRTDSGKNLSLENLRRPVAEARLRQWERNRKANRNYTGPDWLNAYLEPAEISAVCGLDNQSESFIRHASEKNKLSGRSVHSLIKTARTIADMENSGEIKTCHLEEALFFRTWSPSVPDFLS